MSNWIDATPSYRINLDHVIAIQKEEAMINGGRRVWLRFVFGRKHDVPIDYSEEMSRQLRDKGISL